MASLAFRALDQHVVHGRADQLALDLQGSEGRARLTYAQLLERSAALAGGLRAVGVEPGSAVAVLLPSGLEQVVTLLALTRVGALAAADAAVRVEGAPPHLHVGELAYEWATLLTAGATDPLGAPAEDAEGYEQAMRGEHGALLDTLVAGGTWS